MLGLILAPSASAAIECRFEPTTRLLSVTTTEGGFDEGEAIVRRVGGRIAVVGFLGSRVSCGGAPTVANTDRIKLLARGITSITVLLDGGPFAPGATPETDPSPEIEFAVGGTGFVELVGGSGADHFRFTTEAGESGLNLDPGPEDRDVDVALPDLGETETLFVANGGPGPDTMDIVNHPAVEVFAAGGPGDDVLIGRGANAFGAILEGEGGRDRIVGGPGFDLITPGRGADTVLALGGPDTVEMSPDGQRDTIDCGNGRDKAIRPDRFDRMRSCERIRHGSRV
jgi:Ca2+-binding RTX toxin-like protein